MARMTPADSSSARNGLLASTYQTTIAATAATKPARPAQPPGVGRKRPPSAAYGSSLVESSAGRSTVVGIRGLRLGAEESGRADEKDGDQRDEQGDAAGASDPGNVELGVGLHQTHKDAADKGAGNRRHAAEDGRREGVYQHPRRAVARRELCGDRREEHTGQPAEEPGGAPHQHGDAVEPDADQPPG